jgi:hypothetical protein
VSRAVLAVALLGWTAPLWAGHGLLNAFAGIAWLPPAGTTPDSVWYPADGLQERSALALADAPTRPTLLDAIGREKLAEAEAMLKAGKTEAAAIALARWQALAQTLVADAGATPSQQRQAANALLEQQYIALTDYLDLPRAQRLPLLTATRVVADLCTALLKQLPRREREGLFFRAEEVRWALEMAAAADEQGL